MRVRSKLWHAAATYCVYCYSNTGGKKFIMVSSDLGLSVAQGYMLLSTMMSSVTIDNLVVPELVQMNSSAVLDCQISATDDRFTVQWLFNRTELVYEWSPGAPPRASGVLEGRLDPAFKISNERSQEGRGFRIARVGPELSGEYTCRVSSDAGEASQIRAMTVFSPEREFVLDVRTNGRHGAHDVECTARGMFPAPELTLEYNHEPLPKQSQRVWREGSLYDASSTAHLRARSGHVTCRLQLPLAGYSAMRERPLHEHHGTHENVEKSKTHHRPNSAPGDTLFFNVYVLITLSIAVLVRS